MIRRIPVKSVTDGQSYVMEGDQHDQLPRDNTVMVDPDSGRVYDPEEKRQLGHLPQKEMIQLPRTHWHAL